MPAIFIRLKILFDKYVQDVISQEELDEFWQLMRDMNENDSLDENLEILWKQRENGVNHAEKADKDKIFSKILLKAGLQSAGVRKLRHRQIWWKTAVAAAIIALTGITGYFLLPDNWSRPIVHLQKPLKIKTAVYTRNITLPDGSTAVVHAGATIDYPPFFQGNTREVFLSGEAYFDIKPNKNKPFIIHAGKLNITVLGTAFNVKSNNDKVTVSVTRGSVKVHDQQKVLAVLKPDQQVIYNIPMEKAEQQIVNAQELVTDWTKEDMIFEGESFADIARVVSKRYDVDIQFKNSRLSQCRIVASFSGTETLENVMDILCAIHGAHYKIMDERRIVIEGKACD